VLLLTEVKKLRGDHKKMGCEKLHGLMASFLDEHHIKMGGDKFFYLMSEHGLQVRSAKRKATTTNSNHLFKRYPNIARNI